MAHTEVGDDGIDVGDRAGDMRRCCETRCDARWSLDAGVPRTVLDVMCRRSTPTAESVRCCSSLESRDVRCRESGAAVCDIEEDEMRVSQSMGGKENLMR